MWNDSKSFLTTILPETLSLHMHEGTSDTAHPVSKYREKHSSIFPASEKASYLAVKCSHFLCETATYIYHTSMQIPCNTQFTFLSDTKYGCTVRKMRTTTENPNSKKNQPTTHTISDISAPFSSSICAKKLLYRHKPWIENKQMGTVTIKSIISPAQKTSCRKQVEIEEK